MKTCDIAIMLVSDEFDASYLEASQNPITPQRTVVITGPPRSGTSMIAQLLHSAGVHLGSLLLTNAEPHNEKGLYEDDKVIKINDLLLATCGGSWVIPPREEDLARVDPGTIIESVCVAEQRKVWGFKDPSFSLLLDLWWGSFARRNPVIVVCHRNPLSIAQSIAKHWNVTIGQGLHLAGEYERRLALSLGNKSECPVLHLSYEAFLKNPTKWTGVLSRFVGVEIEPSLVRPELRHF